MYLSKLPSHLKKLKKKEKKRVPLLPLPLIVQSRKEENGTSMSFYKGKISYLRLPTVAFHHFGLQSPWLESRAAKKIQT
jgi:hypothetical protein